MSTPVTIADTTFTGKDISSGASVYEYTASADYTIRVQVRLAAVVGGGDYVVWVTLNDGDAQSDDKVHPRTTITLLAGETAFWFMTGSFDIKVGDVINVWVDGLGTDQSESGSIRIFTDAVPLQPTVAGRTIDVDANGGVEVGSFQNDVITANAIATTAIGEIADGVWDELLAGHAIAGSAGAGLSAAGSSSDPLLNSVPGTYLTGTAGYALGRIGTGQVKTTSIVAENGDVQTYQGDNYAAIDGRAIDWEDDSVSWPSLSGTSIKILLCGAVEFTGSIVVASGANKKVRLELTQAQSRSIPIGEFQFVVRAELGTTRWTLVDALWTSKKEITVGG